MNKTESPTMHLHSFLKWSASLRRLPGGRKIGDLAYDICSFRWNKQKGVPKLDDAVKYLESLNHNFRTSGVLDVPRELPPVSCDLLVIMPVYNMEKYLVDAIESVLNQQTQYSFKLRIINDGSTDSSPQIIERYSGHPRVEIFHKENGGVSSARNLGMENLDGEFVLFLDSDDMLAEGSIEALVGIARNRNAQLVQGCFYRFVDDNVIYQVNQPEGRNVHVKDIRGFPVTTLIHRSLLDNICFPLGFWYEDVIFETLIFPKAERIVTIPKVIHQYRQTPGSITQSYSNLKQIDSLYSAEMAIRDAMTLGLFDKLPEYYINYFYYLVVLTYSRTHRLSERVRRSIYVCWKHLFDTLMPKERPTDPDYAPYFEAFERDNFRLYDKISVRNVIDFAH